MFVLHGLSDFLRFVLYFIVGYRKKVVFANLRNSFPYKSEQEIKTIAWKFYRNLCDIIIESFKSFTIGERELRKRYDIVVTDRINAYLRSNKGIIAMGGHMANWEWGVLSCSLYISHKCIGIYKPIKNRYIENFMKKKRARFGIYLESIRNTRAIFEKYKEDNAVYLMLSDQSPGSPSKAHWTQFLSQDSAMLMGAEKYAKYNNYPVVYFNVIRKRRSHYQMTIEVLEPKPLETSTGEITEKYTKKLEADIVERPDQWLWSHKRWKHKRTEKVGNES